MAGPWGVLNQQQKPLWPPMWNPFQVFILALALVSSIGLIGGSSGSAILDQRLSDTAVSFWGVCLAVGSVMALAGLWLYRRFDSLMPGLHLERAGCFLVGIACAIYVVVVLHAAAGINTARYTACVNAGFGLACFYRALQDHRAIRRANAMIGHQPWKDMWATARYAFTRSRER
jgi:hypothetical protein